jgi:hypothetical protein
VSGLFFGSHLVSSFVEMKFKFSKDSSLEFGKSESGRLRS